jgi:hypothetical protein
MRATVSKALVATLAMLSAGCDLEKIIAAFGVRTEVSAGVPGCYALYAGHREVDSSFYNATHLVRLDSTVSRSFERQGRRVLFRALRRLDARGHELDNEDTRGSGFFSWWADSLTDTLRLSFVDGFSGAALALAKDRGTDTLRGRIEEHWDAGPPFVTNQQPAYAIKIPCK